MTKKDTDFEILREYAEAIKKFKGKNPVTPEEREEFTAITRPYLKRLTDNMGHSLSDGIGLLRAAFQSYKEEA